MNKFLKVSFFSIIIFICNVLFLGQLYAIPTVKVVISPNDTNISPAASPIALTAKASGTELTFEWELLGVGTFKGRTTGSAIFYVPPEKIGQEEEQAIISVKVTDKDGQEATESIIFIIRANEESSPTPTVSDVDSSSTSFPSYDDYIITCEDKIKIDSHDLAYPFRKKPWLVEWLKVCDTDGWNIVAWEIKGSERICRYKIRLYDEEEVKNTLQDGNLFASKEVLFTPQDVKNYPEGRKDRCQSGKEQAWSIGVVPAHTR